MCWILNVMLGTIIMFKTTVFPLVRFINILVNHVYLFVHDIEAVFYLECIAGVLCVGLSHGVKRTVVVTQRVSSCHNQSWPNQLDKLYCSLCSVFTTLYGTAAQLRETSRSRRRTETRSVERASLGSLTKDLAGEPLMIVIGRDTLWHVEQQISSEP